MEELSGDVGATAAVSMLISASLAGGVLSQTRRLLASSPVPRAAMRTAATSGGQWM